MRDDVIDEIGAEEEEPKRGRGRPKGAKDTYKRKMPKRNGYARDLGTERVTSMVDFYAAITPTEPLAPHDVDEMERRFANYMALCAEYGKKPGNLACYLALGIATSQVTKWARDNTDVRRRDFIMKVKGVMGAIREELGADGEIPPALAIFFHSNYDGLQDVRNIQVAPAANDSAEVDAGALADKYLEAVNVTPQLEAAKTEEPDGEEKKE